MKRILKPLTAGAMALAIAGPALADGVYKMYDYREGYVDELEIIGDVVLDGETFALFEMKNMQMQFYVPQDAAYVMVEASNPIIANNQVFEGGWTSTAPPGEERWAPCSGDAVTDHNSQDRAVWGEMTWTYTALDNYDLHFKLGLGHCDGEIEDWAWNDPSRELPSEEEAMEICGNERDNELRALGCSDVISNPTASASNVSWAHWSRAYVRCSSAPVEDLIADFMAAARTDTLQWQEYWQRVSGYEGPMDGQVNYQLYGAASRWANQRCR